MKIEIELQCPDCQGIIIKKRNGKQNYCCKSCFRQFIGDHQLTYLGCQSSINRKIEKMLVRNCRIFDIPDIKYIRIGKVLSVLTRSRKIIQPKLNHYDRLEVDKFWTYVGNKNHKVWLIYAYHRETGEIVARVGGNKMPKQPIGLRKRLTV